MADMEKWLVISACQSVGLANCIQSLVKDVNVTGMDYIIYNKNKKIIRNDIQKYSKIFINSGIKELISSDDINLIKEHIECPSVFFRAYHPDTIYLEYEKKPINDPLSDYHSAICYACFTKGMSIADTLRHFNGNFFERCGYMSLWVPERERLINEMKSAGIDISEPIRRWGRERAFMHSMNHPLIHVLHDIAAELVRMQGRPPLNGGFIPHDNLLTGPQFAVYPEIAESLGVPGSYIFKGYDYRPIDLVEFITKSFEIYNKFPRGSITPHPHFQENLDNVIAAL